MPGRRYFDGNAWTEQRAAPQELPPKSAVAAGLLQLFFGCLGIGRFYIGSTAIAGTQLALGVLGILLTPAFGVGLVILVPLSIWAFIDAIMMFAGAVTDSEGRKLR